MSDYQKFGIIFAIVCLVAAGCSGPGNPVTPQSSATNPGSPELSSAGVPDMESGSRHDLWLYDLIYVDPTSDNFDVELVPLRQVSGHWNVLTWLENGPCMTCLSIVSIDQSTSGTLLVYLRITHPFPLANLTGFDVRGIPMFNASDNFQISGLTYSNGAYGDGELVNPDGYTTLYNYTTEGLGFSGMQGYMKGKMASLQTPNALLNGYKRHRSMGTENTRNAFYAGESVTVIYEIDMPDGPFVFGYAVDASWVPPTTKPVTDPMTDFPPEANCPEAWRLEVTDLGPGLGIFGDPTTIRIDVYDWQDPSLNSPPKLECKEVFNGIITATLVGIFSGYARYEAEVPNETPAPIGIYDCLVSVESEENQGAPDWLDLTAYQITKLYVGNDPEFPPVAIASADPTSAKTGDPVTFTADGSYDPDGGTIQLYEWDFDNDGTWDESAFETEHTWTEPGNYYVQLRVTDDEAQADTLDEPLEITITEAGVSGWARSWSDDFNWNTEVDADSIGNVYTVGNSGSLCTIRKLNSAGDEIWLKAWGDTGMGICDGVGVDSGDNIYATGWYMGTVDFDPGDGEDIHESSGPEIFLVKYNSAGEYLWGKTWGADLAGDSYWWQTGHGVAVSDAGNVFVCGQFRGTGDFDPGPEVEERTSNGYDLGGFDAFVSCFGDDGNFKWVNTWGAPNTDNNHGERAYAVAVDNPGSCYVLGGFLGTVDFDPGSGTVEYTSTGQYGDIVLLKYAPTGDLEWARTWRAIGWADTGFGINQLWGGSHVTADNTDGIYVTGFYQGMIDFDPGPGETEKDGDGGFLSKFDPDGNFVWVDTWMCSNITMMNGYALKTDSNDEVYFAGSFGETVDLDPGPGVDQRSPSGMRDGFLMRIDAHGDLVWALNWGVESGGSDFAEGWGCTVDSADNPYVCGIFRGTVDFDPGPGEDKHTAGSWGSYLVKYLPDGTW